MDRDEVVEGLVAGSSYNTLSIDSGGSGNEDAPAIADTLGDVDLSLDQIENREALRPLLAALPERERTVLLLRFFESLTQTQIAERVGISQMHVSRLLAKSLARLRDQLQWGMRLAVQARTARPRRRGRSATPNPDRKCAAGESPPYREPTPSRRCRRRNAH